MRCGPIGPSSFTNCVTSPSAVGGEREHGQAGPDVVGHHHEPARRVERQVDRVLALRALPVDEAEPAGCAVDGKGADVGQIAVHRVEPVAGGVQREERWVDEVLDELDGRKPAGLRVDAEHADAVSAGVALARGARAHIGVQIHGFRRG
ncbi:hypothetical protein RPSD_35880 (plasmid) [Ralstonia solanacearum]|nr:hypothetical protein RPSD_35880 [Ralstonia solanacearum]